MGRFWLPLHAICADMLAITALDTHAHPRHVAGGSEHLGREAAASSLQRSGPV